MKFEPRQYQQDTVDALWNVVKNQPGKNPVIAVPTGAGKTVIMGMFIKKYIEEYPHDRVVVLSHTQDILEQDYEALGEFFNREIGLYSSGLNSRTVEQITVAGIQSAYRQPKKFAFTNLYLIDECHTVSHKAQGMYRNLLGRTPSVKVGMSATVFRTGHGYIYENGALFDWLAYDLTSIENFNKLVSDGYLTKLISLSTSLQLDSDKVKKSAGDYNIKDLSKAHDKESITNEAVQEVIKYGQNYKKWLIFAIDIDHADSICATLRSNDIDADVLHSRMDSDRKHVTNLFKTGSTRALVSVGMVTTGFDAPNVDMVVLLRPTMSAVLHVQMVGRGLRVAPGKDHCLVLDFAGNTARLGPINDVQVPKQKGEGTGEAPTKVCPECSVILPASVRECSICGHEFKFQIKITATSDTSEIVAKSKDRWLNVTSVQYQIHKKIGKPDSVLVIYHCGISRVKDWVHPEHGGYAGRKADHWLRRRGYTGSHDSKSVVDRSHTIAEPKRILVDYSEKYPNIKETEF